MASVRKRILLGPDGKPRRGADGKPIETRCYYVRYYDHNGKRREVKGFTDKKATESLGRRLETQAARRRVGLIDRFDEHARRLLVDHADDYRKSLEAGGHSRKYVGNTDRWIRAVLDGTKANYFTDLTPSAVQGYIGALAAKGLAPRTLNNYLAAVQGFLYWAVKDQRLPASPLVGMARRNIAVDLRRRRRSLTMDELSRLVAAAETGPTIDAVDGPTRAVSYMLAGYLGLRRGEVGGLRMSDVDFDAETITVRAAVSKNRKLAVLPMHPALRERLRTYLSNRETGNPDEAILPVGDKETWRMVREDLKAAGIASETDSGRVDFHSLRVSFASNLGRSGVPIQTARQLMRHSTVELTARVYTKLELHDLEGAVQRLPDLSSGPDAQAAKGTGTDGRPAERSSSANTKPNLESSPSLPPLLPPRADASGLFVANPGKVAASADAGKNPRFPRRNSGNSRELAKRDNSMSLTGKAPRACRNSIFVSSNAERW